MDILELDTHIRIEDLLDLRFFFRGDVFLLYYRNRNAIRLDAVRPGPLGHQLLLLRELPDLLALLINLLFRFLDSFLTGPNDRLMQPGFCPGIAGRNQQDFLKDLDRSTKTLMFQVFLTVLDEFRDALRLDLFRGKLGGLDISANGFRVQRLESGNGRRIGPGSAQLQFAVALLAVDPRVLHVRIQRDRTIELAERFQEQIAVIQVDSTAKVAFRFGNVLVRRCDLCDGFLEHRRRRLRRYGRCLSLLRRQGQRNHYKCRNLQHKDEAACSVVT